MKKNRIEKYEIKKTPPISSAEHRANCEHIVDALLMPIIEKMRKSPNDIKPVKESWSELIDQMNNSSIKRQPAIIQTSESEKNNRAEPTLSNVGGAENSGEKSVTILNAEDLAILETLK